MNLFKTTYNYIISTSRFERLKSKSNNDLSEIFVPVNIGKAGVQRIKTCIVWSKTNEKQIKLHITSNVDKFNIGILVGIVLVTLFMGYLYSVVVSLFLLIIVFFPLLLIFIGTIKSKAQSQTIEYLKNI